MPAAASRELIKGAAMLARRPGAASTRRAARRSLDLFTRKRRRLPRPLVRERGGQGRLRLRRHRRHLRRAVHAGHRLRAAAPLLRRGERQAAASGATPSAAWAPSRRRWRRRRRERGVEIRTGAKVREVMIENGAAPRRACWRAARRFSRAPSRPTSAPKLLFRDLVPEGAVDAGDCAHCFTGMKTGLGHLPHERGAVASCRISPAGPAPTQQDHHGSGIVIGPTLDYLERAYLDARTTRLVARAGGRDAHPLDARCHAGAAGPARGEPVRAARGAAPARGAQLGRRAREGSLRRPRHRHGDAHAPNFERVGARPRRSCRRSISSSASAWSTATSSTAHCRSISCSRLRPRPRLRRLPHAAGGPLPVRRRARIRAAASPACPGTTRPARSSAISRVGAAARIRAKPPHRLRRLGGERPIGPRMKTGT